MKRLATILSLTILAALTLAPSHALEDGAQEETSMYSHLVFFDLKDDSDTAKQALVDAFDKYLAPHDGIVAYTASIRDADKQRDVNDSSFDVALTIIFEDEAAQDAYQVTDPHLKFIEEMSENWEQVRVFDSVVAGDSYIIGAKE